MLERTFDSSRICVCVCVCIFVVSYIRGEIASFIQLFNILCISHFGEFKDIVPPSSRYRSKLSTRSSLHLMLIVMKCGRALSVYVDVEKIINLILYAHAFSQHLEGNHNLGRH